MATKRLVWWILRGTIAAGLLGGVALVVFLLTAPGIVERIAIDQLARLGCDGAALSVRAISPRRIVVSDAYLDAHGSARIATVSVDYGIRSLIMRRGVLSIHAAGAELTVRLRDGVWDLGAISQLLVRDARADSSPRDHAPDLSFDRFDLEASSLILDLGGRVTRVPVSATVTRTGVSTGDLELEAELPGGRLLASGSIDLARGDWMLALETEPMHIGAICDTLPPQWTASIENASGRVALDISLSAADAAGGRNVRVAIDGSRLRLPVGSDAAEVQLERVALTAQGHLDQTFRFGLKDVELAADSVDAPGVRATQVQIQARPGAEEAWQLDATAATIEQPARSRKASGRWAARGVRFEGRATATLGRTASVLELLPGGSFQVEELAVLGREAGDWACRAPAGEGAAPAFRASIGDEACRVSRTARSADGDAGGIHVLAPSLDLQLIDAVASRGDLLLSGSVALPCRIHFGSDGFELFSHEGAGVWLDALSAAIGDQHASTAGARMELQASTATPLFRLARSGAAGGEGDVGDGGRMTIDGSFRSQHDLAVKQSDGRSMAMASLAIGGTLAFGMPGMSADAVVELQGATVSGADASAATAEVDSLRLAGRYASAREPAEASWHVTALLDAPRVELPGPELDLIGLRVEIPWQSGDDDGAGASEGAFQIDGLHWRDHEWVGPSGSVWASGASLGVLAGWNPAGDIHLEMKGQLESAGGELLADATFDLSEIALGEEPALEEFLPPDLVSLARGSVAANGTVAWCQGRLQPDLTVRLDGVGVESAKYDAGIENLHAVVRIDGLGGANGVTTPGAQELRFDRARLGKIEATAGAIDFSVEGTRSILVERANWGWAGGRLFVHALRVDPRDPGVEFELFGDGLELDELLVLIPGGGVSGTGKIHGRLPVSVRWPEISYGSGYLYGEPGGGEVLIGRDSRAGAFLLESALPGGTDVVGQVRERIKAAIGHFEYTVFRTLFVDEEGVLSARIHLEGEGVDNGQPMVLDLNVHHIDEALNGLLIMKRIREAISPGR